MTADSRLVEASTVEVDGIIKNAQIVPWGDRRLVLGVLYGDRKGRFADGTEIRTSSIVSGPDEHGVIHTRNSIYRLEMAPKHAADLAACEAIVGEVEAAETEFRAGHPHAARMHLHEAANRARALSVGEEI